MLSKNSNILFYILLLLSETCWKHKTFHYYHINMFQKLLSLNSLQNETKTDDWWLTCWWKWSIRPPGHSVSPVWRLTGHVRVGVVTAPLMTQNRKSVREICSNKEELFKIGLETQFSIDSLFSYFPRRKMRKYPIKWGQKTEFIFWNIGTVQICRRVLMEHAGGRGHWHCSLLYN